LTVDAAWVGLSLIEQMGAKRLRALTAHFDGDLAAILAADEHALRRVPGIGAVMAAAIRKVDVERVRANLSAWAEEGITPLVLGTVGYPPRLAAIPDAPPTLFLRGRTDWMERRALAVIGTRTPSHVGAMAARALGAALAARDILVVSGMALGIDTGGHHGALSLRKHGDTSPERALTVAVWGGGLHQLYPRESGILAQVIALRGALVSEGHPDAEPTAPRLVARNRIIAGLCEAVIVVESTLDGGAMHAARRALEYGRTVYTLDLPATGNQALLGMGAQVITPELVGLAGQ